MSHIKLIVGLGNPGAEYARTRHNVGAWLVESIAADAGTTLNFETKFHGNIANCRINGEKIFLLVPTTYMNDSGRSVLAVAHYYKIAPEAILVAHDELDIPVGDIKLKQDGGHGGHNGLRDIIKHLGSKNFVRVRIGIGHPGDRKRVTNYVLSAPNAQDEAKIVDGIHLLENYLPDLVAGQLAATMKTIHTKG